MTKLPPKYERLCQEFLVDANQTQAAIRAGYSPKSAKVTASRIFARPEVQRRLVELIKKQAKRTGVSADRTLREVGLIAHSDIGDVLDFRGNTLTLRRPKDIPKRARRAIASVKVRRVVDLSSAEEPREVEVVEFKFWNKNDALDKLMKHFGLVSGEQGNPNDPSDLARLFAQMVRSTTEGSAPSGPDDVAP